MVTTVGRYLLMPLGISPESPWYISMGKRRAISVIFMLRHKDFSFCQKKDCGSICRVSSANVTFAVLAGLGLKRYSLPTRCSCRVRIRSRL